MKLFESQLKESEEKRKKSIIDQHEAEYATRKIKSEHERLKIENSCLKNLLDLKKSKVKASNNTETKLSMPDLKRKRQQDDQQTTDPQLKQHQVPQVQVKDSQVQVSQVPDPHVEDLQVQLEELHVQLEEPKVQLSKPQLQEPLVKLQVQDPIVKDHQSTLKAYRSYKEALGTSQKSKEIFFSCEECSYPFK